MPERAELRPMREEMRRRGLNLAKISTSLSYPFCQFRLLFLPDWKALKPRASLRRQGAGSFPHIPSWSLGGRLPQLPGSPGPEDIAREIRRPK